MDNTANDMERSIMQANAEGLQWLRSRLAWEKRVNGWRTAHASSAGGAAVCTDRSASFSPEPSRER